MFSVVAMGRSISLVQSEHKTLKEAVKAAKKHDKLVWIQDFETGETFDSNGDPRLMRD